MEAARSKAVALYSMELDKPVLCYLRNEFVTSRIQNPSDFCLKFQM